MRLKQGSLKLSLALYFALLTCGPTFGAGFTLTIITNGSGGVTRNPTNSVYPSGATVTLTATPTTAWLFSGWTGDEVSSANPLNVLMTGNKTLMAHFELIPSYNVTTSVNGSGSVSLNPSVGPYMSNTVISATASPSAGWVFLNWSGDVTGTANPIGITINSNKAVTAVFAQIAAITTPLQDLGVGLGQSAGFTVQAVGTEPLSFQWYFAENAVAGATTSTLTVPNVQIENEGVYGIVVTNLYGSSSNFALLTITNACFGDNVVRSPSEAELRNAIAVGGLVRCCFNGTVVLTDTIHITHDVTLDAQDRRVTISGNDAVRLFNVHPGVAFSATNVAFVHGRQVGTNGAPVGAQPAQPGQSAEGAAICCNSGTVQLVRCILAANSVVGGNGGNGLDYVHPGAGGEARGGAVFVADGSLFVQGGILFGNSATGGLGGLSPSGGIGGQSGNSLGGALYVTNGTLRVSDATITSNVCYALKGGIGTSTAAQAVGGGIAVSSGSITLTNSVICTNTVLGQESPIFGNYPASNSWCR